MIAVRENYKSYTAPPWFHRSVERLLEFIPKDYLIGISAIVLTDSDRLARSSRVRRSRRNRRGETLARYHGASRNGPALIELVADRIADGIPRPFDRLQFVRDLAVARALFHEVGHHLHATRRALKRDGESSAEAWQIRLSRTYFRDHYWYLRPLFVVLAALKRRRRARLQREGRAPSSASA